MATVWPLVDFLIWKVKRASCDLVEKTSKAPSIPTLCFSCVLHLLLPGHQIQLCCLRSVGKPLPFSRDRLCGVTPLTQQSRSTALCILKPAKKEKKKLHSQRKNAIIHVWCVCVCVQWIVLLLTETLPPSWLLIVTNVLLRVMQSLGRLVLDPDQYSRGNLFMFYHPESSRHVVWPQLLAIVTGVLPCLTNLWNTSCLHKPAGCKCLCISLFENMPSFLSFSLSLSLFLSRSFSLSLSLRLLWGEMRAAWCIGQVFSFLLQEKKKLELFL